MMSRDSDSYINDRELVAVQEWMDSNKEETFHVMRDHPGHCNIYILGGLKTSILKLKFGQIHKLILPLLAILGMWGVKLYRNRESVRIAAELMLNGTVHNHDYDSDQQLLKRFIWPMAKFDSVILTYFTFCLTSFNSSI